MTKGMHKKPSKRIPAKRRYKIEKKVREHNRKLRKELKRKNHRSGKHKDPGIPNSLPFKEKVLNELEEFKKRNLEMKEIMRVQQKKNREQEQQEKQMSKVEKRRAEFELLLSKAEERAAEFEVRNQAMDISDDINTSTTNTVSNTKSFYKDVQKVIESSDIIIQVVDARDPLGTRCFEIEDIVSKNYPDKKIILLMNKCDLIPKENLVKWLKYLRNFFITIPFKSCTQSQKQNLSTSKVNIMLSSDDLLKSSKCLGVDFLMKILNQYCHNKGVKTSITIGIVGFPNVGKSSVINSLKRSYVCNVGPTPGLTRSMQTISLDKKIKLIDSPGIVFAKNVSDDQNSSQSSILALRNVLNIDKLSDPILPVQAILNRVDSKDLLKIYNLSQFSTVQEFLSLVARRFGKVLKGGRLDMEAAAKKVLHDWNIGKLRYYTIPPENTDSAFEPKIVDQMSDGFNIEEFTQEVFMSVDQFSGDSGQQEYSFPLKSVETRIQIDDDMNTGKLANQHSQNVDVEMEEISGMQLNKQIKSQFKKAKKQRRRNEMLSNQFEEKIDLKDGEEDYDFNEYF